MTVCGWKTHGELRVGDYVFSPSGKPVKVVALSPDCMGTVKMTFTNGATIYCHENHEWKVYYRSVREWMTVEAKYFLTPVKTGYRAGEIRKLQNEVVGRGHRYHFQIPQVDALQFPYREDLPLDPYTLGVWLGDGTSDAALICGAPVDMAHIVPKIPYERSKSYVQEGTGVAYQRYGEKMRASLKAANVFKNKHIPEAYFLASEEQRRQLLAGLVDTDGSVDKTGRVIFVGCNERLVRDVARLAGTLGYRSKVYSRSMPVRKVARTIVDRQVVWESAWTPHDGKGQGTLPRKVKPVFRLREKIAIKSVERCEPKPGRCIQVENEDGLYLAGRELIPTHNSKLSSVCFPSWAMTKNPDLKFFQAGFNGDLSKGFSREARALVESDRYKQFFPDLINPSVNRQEFWQTKLGGYYYATSVGGGTGTPADCLTGNTLIQTEFGVFKIADAHTLPAGTRVLSYEPETRTECWRRIVAVASRPASELYRIHTAAGAVVEATCEHPFFTEGRWVKAGDLAPGDRLVRTLRQETEETCLRDEKALRQRVREVLLLSILRGGGMSPQECDTLPDVRKEDAAVGAVLLGNVQAELAGEAEDGATSGQTEAGVSAVRGAVHRATLQKHLLRSEVREPSALKQDATGEQPDVQRRPDPQASCATEFAAIQEGAIGDTATGFSCVRGVRIGEEAGDSPYQSRPDGQSSYESRDALHDLPHEVPCSRTVDTVSDTVSLVERVCGDTQVFNLQVEGTESFFANGILTHNCIIIDDPHKDRAEANSEAQRNRVWEWFTSTATTRLAPNGVVIVIQTRWHKDDLIGRLTDPKRVKEFTDAGFTDMNFEVLSLEAICENPATDPLGRQMGEALWPEKRGVRELAIKRKEIGNFEWNSLYQQRPNPPGGNVANIHLIKTIDFSQLPKGLRKVRGWDLALSNSTRADFSCGALGAMDAEGNLYLMHMDRKRRLWPEQKKAIVSYAEREAVGGEIAIEAVSAFKIGASELRTELGGKTSVKEFTPLTDKLSRAQPWINKIDAGQFYMVEGLWNQDFLDELEQFPVGSHDDQVDAVTVMYSSLKRERRLVLA